MAMVLALGVAGVAGASIITLDDPGNFTSYQYLGTSLGFNQTKAWSFTTPDGFMVPPDVVTSATVYINAIGVYSNYNRVSITGVGNFTLNPDVWTWSGGWTWKNNGSNTYIDVADAFTPSWGEGNSLGVSVTSGQYFSKIYLNYSTLDVSYTNGGGGGGGGDPVHAPEPGTLLLLGSGLVGLSVYGRKKFRK